MTNENNETIIDSQETNENGEVVLETEETLETSDNTEEVNDATVEKTEKPIESPEARLARLKRMVERQEKKLGIKKEVKPQQISSDISTKDIIALTKANIDEDDIQEVQDYAKFKNISITEALKSSTVKNILAERAETRKTANATNVANARRSPAKVSVESLISDFDKGNMPDSDDDLKAIIKAKKRIKN